MFTRTRWNLDQNCPNCHLNRTAKKLQRQFSFTILVHFLVEYGYFWTSWELFVFLVHRILHFIWEIVIENFSNGIKANGGVRSLMIHYNFLLFVWFNMFCYDSVSYEEFIIPFFIRELRPSTKDNAKHLRWDSWRDVIVYLLPLLESWKYLVNLIRSFCYLPVNISSLGNVWDTLWDMQFLLSCSTCYAYVKCKHSKEKFQNSNHSSNVFLYNFTTDWKILSFVFR